MVRKHRNINSRIRFGKDSRRAIGHHEHRSGVAAFLIEYGAAVVAGAE